MGKNEYKLPSRRAASHLVEGLVWKILPEAFNEPENGFEPFEALSELISSSLVFAGMTGSSAALAERFIELLPDIRRKLLLDALEIYEGDPAAASSEEVMLSYTSFYAIAVYRIAHGLWLMSVPVLPRLLTEHAHSLTGIDIHPGAEIGESFFIDHGTGVVIGETAILGNHVRLYQGVTLGARSFERDSEGRVVRGTRRHPRIGDGTVIYAGATILGGDTVVGENCIIGANVRITSSVPPLTTVSSVP